MKTIIMAVIPLLTALLGYLLSVRYGEKRDFWERFSFWHKKIKSEIVFSQNSLPEIFNKNDTSSKDDLFLSVAKDYLINNKVGVKLNFLGKEEKEFIDKYFSNLGKTDKNSQLNLLNSLETELDKFVSDSDNKNKKYRPLYVKMGFLIGLIIFILVI